MSLPVSKAEGRWRCNGFVGRMRAEPHVDVQWLATRCHVRRARERVALDTSYSGGAEAAAESRGAAQITQSELNAHWVFSMPPSDTGFNAQVREDKLYSMLNTLRCTAVWLYSMLNP